MKSLSEYGQDTSAYELMSFTLEKLLSGELGSFSEFVALLDSVPRDNRVEYVYRRWFAAFRKMSWGIFRDLEPQAYRDLWATLVIPAPGYAGAGDLKRNMTITTIFCGIIDIHGYSEFCQKIGNNVSMLQLLDDVIQKEVRAIAKERGVIAQRSRGDEIILLGAGAIPVTKTVMAITDFFSKRRVIKEGAMAQDREGKNVILPDMTISAGIAGGQKYTPLVITADGDVSGHLINSAARLQSRANKLSPKRTKVLMTTHVRSALAREEKVTRNQVLTEESQFFWPAGQVTFKGLSLGVQELVFHEDAAYKAALRAAFEAMLASLKAERWEDKIFESAVVFVERTCAALPTFILDSSGPGARYRNQDVRNHCALARETFVAGKDYGRAFEMLSELVAMAARIEGFDEHVLEYLEAISENYQYLYQAFTDELEAMVEKRIEYLLPIHLREAYKKAEQNAQIYRKLREKAHESPELGNRKSMWFRVVDRNRDKVEFNIYSGKK